MDSGMGSKLFDVHIRCNVSTRYNIVEGSAERCQVQVANKYSGRQV